MPKRTYVKVITAQHTASFSYLREPDSGREYSDDKFKVTALVSKSDEAGLKILRDACMKAAQAEWPEGIPSNIRMPLRDGAEKSADLADYFLVTFKSQKAPALVDAAGAALAHDINVFSGDVIRVAGAAGAYVAGGNKGVTLYLNGVQLIEKRAGGDETSHMFDAVEGGFTQELPPVETASDDAGFNF